MYRKIIILQVIVVLFSFSSAYGADGKENMDGICKNYKSIYIERFGLITQIFVGEFVKPLYGFSNIEAHSPTEYAQYRVKRILYSRNSENWDFFSENSDFLKVNSLITVTHNFTNLAPSKKKKQTYELSEDIFYSGARLILFVWSKKEFANDLRYKVLKDNPENRKLVESLVRCAKNVWSQPKKTDD